MFGHLVHLPFLSLVEPHRREIPDGYGDVRSDSNREWGSVSVAKRAGVVVLLLVVGALLGFAVRLFWPQGEA